MTSSHDGSGARTGRRVLKAVIPAAGLGTRFLPATKATPKEMLPVVDKPAIQYVVEEATRAGLRNILMITGRNKTALEDHFDRHWELEKALEAKGDEMRLKRVRKSANLGNVHFVRQGEPLGLGHAVLCAADHVGDDPFAVLLGDDLIDERDHLLEQMIDVREEHGGSVVALMEVPPEQVHLYGCAAVESVPGSDGSVVRVTGLVEKPDPADAPSNLAIIGRYVLDPSIFDHPRQHPARARRRDPADRRAAGAGRRPDHRRRCPRRRLLRPPLRHRRPAGLPQGRRPPGQRAPRARHRLLEVARRLRLRGGEAHPRDHGRAAPEPHPGHRPAAARHRHRAARRARLRPGRRRGQRRGPARLPQLRHGRIRGPGGRRGRRHGGRAGSPAGRR